MPDCLTIVMYHYIRDYRSTPYPGIKGLDARDFASQLDYFSKYYVFVTLEECIGAMDGGQRLPSNALLLTFDDGYVDHYEHVFPLLRMRGLQGTFFVSAAPSMNKTVLEVNKIHHILAVSPDPSLLLKRILALIAEKRGTFGLEDPLTYAASVTETSRYNSGDVLIIKHLLQRILPPPARKAITGELFADLVTSDERGFSERLYLNVDQMRDMALYGMAFGHHGFSHEWLPFMSRKDREEDLIKGLEILHRIGVRTDAWAISYPYGAHDTSCAELARAHGCALGVTITAAVARLDPEQRLVLPRFDTNDFPRTADAPPNEWTLQVQPGSSR